MVLLMQLLTPIQNPALLRSMGFTPGRLCMLRPDRLSARDLTMSVGESLVLWSERASAHASFRLVITQLASVRRVGQHYEQPASDDLRATLSLAVDGLDLRFWARLVAFSPML